MLAGISGIGGIFVALATPAAAWAKTHTAGNYLITSYFVANTGTPGGVRNAVASISAFTVTDSNSHIVTTTCKVPVTVGTFTVVVQETGTWTAKKVISGGRFPLQSLSSPSYSGVDRWSHETLS